ncbi:MAG: nucleoside triphosphate pyrophosphohydrolase [Pseudomonadales bacterium]|nr:nucleoside triphosphate pyrophosphohydrolase [Pseudomonadales bacterium]
MKDINTDDSVATAEQAPQATPDPISDDVIEAASPFRQVEYMMERLRDPKTGCEWDRKQDFSSIASYTIEEAYEVVDAIEKHQMPQLKDELGDLLLQVVFHSQMANEIGAFSFQDVAKHLVEKMVRRHPHVFPQGTLGSRIGPNHRPEEAQIKQRWDEIKQQEKREKGEVISDTTLGDIPVGMAPLKRAEKLQKNAAKVGFDWPNYQFVLDKMAEELAEVNEAVTEDSPTQRIAEEVGDLMFCCVNLLRHLKHDPEMVMKQANDKFEKRYKLMEAWLKENGHDISTTDLDTMEKGWVAAKQAGDLC